jgi:hypothetical protein
VTTVPDAYAAIASARTATRVLDARRPLPALDEPLVVVEGIDDVGDAGALLRALRAATGTAHLYALIANGAYAATLAAFVDGGPAPAAHPLVEGEVAPLFTAAGWRTARCVPIVEGEEPALPHRLVAGPLSFLVHEREVARRLRTLAFVVVAEPA